MSLSPPPNPDDALRRLAAERLAEHLDMGVRLVARCQSLADAQRGDRLGPLSAAARLMNSNARVAQALAHVALVERRQRTIIERIQPTKPDPAELNSKNAQTEVERREAFRQLEERFLGGLAEERRRKLEEPADPHEEAHERAVVEYENEFGVGSAD